MHQNEGQIDSIYSKKDGNIQKNRSGCNHTIGIFEAIKLLSKNGALPESCKLNLHCIIEIRDNSIHFINKDLKLSKKIQEFGTASLKNYVTLINEWFEKDMSKYNFYLMPISFYHLQELESFSTKKKSEQIKKLSNYLNQIQASNQSEDVQDYDIALRIETKFAKASEPSLASFKYSNDADVTVKITEEEIFKKYPLTYYDLLEKLKNKFTDFKQNPKFYALKKDFEDVSKYGEKYCKIKYLKVDKKGTSTKYYSTEMIKKFGEHYTRK